MLQDHLIYMQSCSLRPVDYSADYLESFSRLL